MSHAARTYNQDHIARKYTPGKRRLSIYWSWSYPWESQRDLTEMENRFSTMTEVRRVAWPNYEKPEWGSAQFLQRYMFHADLHLGKSLRFFGKLKNGIESGRNGGPRPPDEDKLDVHQAFADLTLQSHKSRSIVLRFGRQEMSFGSQRLISTREGPKRTGELRRSSSFY